MGAAFLCERAYLDIRFTTITKVSGDFFSNPNLQWSGIQFQLVSVNNRECKGLFELT